PDTYRRLFRSHAQKSNIPKINPNKTNRQSPSPEQGVEVLGASTIINVEHTYASPAGHIPAYVIASSSLKSLLKSIPIRSGFMRYLSSTVHPNSTPPPPPSRGWLQVSTLPCTRNGMSFMPR